MKRFLHFLIIFYSISLNASENIITTSSGKVIAQNIKGVLFFEDIPYAEPPVGYLRWKAPRVKKGLFNKFSMKKKRIVQK